MSLILPVLLDALIDRALGEDLLGDDITTDACVAPDVRASAVAIARRPAVVCGSEVFRRVFSRVDPGISVDELAQDGHSVRAGTHLWRASGSARSLLLAERTALNFVQRMSGIATLTHAYVDALPKGSGVRITDTRKTTPGLRALERYAVRVGGGHNHRDNLGSAVLIKDNHIVAAGGISKAIARARERAPHTSRIEVEVASVAELDEALAARADIIMLDNFSLPDLRAAVDRARAVLSSVILEVSGGVTLENIPALAASGVDVISVGALTHSAPAADIALDLTLQ